LKPDLEGCGLVVERKKQDQHFCKENRGQLTFDAYETAWAAFVKIIAILSASSVGFTKMPTGK
jgi:hypothetical protein